MSVYQRPTPKIRPRIDHASRQLGLRNTVSDPRPAQKAPAPEPVIANSEVKAIQNNFGVPRADDTREMIVGRLVRVHTCVDKLRDPGARCKCTERIPENDALTKVANGNYRWLESTKSDGSVYRQKAIIKTDTPLPEKLILVHACLLKKDRCHCKYQVPLSRAESLIAEGRATSRPVERNGVSYPMHSSIVLSRSEVRKMEQEIKKKKWLRAEAIQKFRIRAEHEGGITLTEDDLILALKGEFQFTGALESLNDVSDGTGTSLGRALRAQSPTLADLFLRAIGWYWNRLIPTMARYLYCVGPSGKREALVSGGYDTIANGYLDLISSHSDEGDPRNDEDQEHSPFPSSFHAVHGGDHRVRPEGTAPESTGDVDPDVPAPVEDDPANEESDSESMEPEGAAGLE